MLITKNQAIKICEKLRKDFISIKFLARGNHNESYLLKTKEESFVIRIENNHQYKNLKNEYKFLKLINGKYAPKVFLFDNTKKIVKKDYLVEEFVNGKHPQKKIDNQFIKLMALWYKKLHNNKKILSETKRNKLNLKNQFIKHNKQIKIHKNEVSKAVYTQYEEAYNNIEQVSINRKYACIVHGDPSRSNVFYDKKEVKLIDWEFVRYDYPETDLVFFRYSYDLTKKQWQFFLKTYGYRYSQKILNTFFADHYIGMILWKFQRLHLISTKKVDKKQKASNKTKMIKEIKEDIENMMRVLK